MLPIFWFIGCGVLLSLDIMQPSMFADIPGNVTLFVIALAIGLAPVLLVTNALDLLLQQERTKLRSFYAASIVGIFMLSEIIYSYTSVKGFFGTEDVPILKIIGILFLPLTFSLYYFIGLFLKPIENNAFYTTAEHDIVPIPSVESSAHSQIQQLLNERESILVELKLLGIDAFIEENNNNV